MEQELFNPKSPSVNSSRILYTPSVFARTSLLHLHEVGSLKAIQPHTLSRTNLTSFLCFVVVSGEGELIYDDIAYQLSQGDCVFIDCRKAYGHRTGYDADQLNNESNNVSNLWSLQWCHFNAPFLPAIYDKYKEHGGLPVFHPDNITPFTTILTRIYELHLHRIISGIYVLMNLYQHYLHSLWNSHGIWRVRQ